MGYLYPVVYYCALMYYFEAQGKKCDEKGDMVGASLHWTSWVTYTNMWTTAYLEAHGRFPTYNAWRCA